MDICAVLYKLRGHLKVNIHINTWILKIHGYHISIFYADFHEFEFDA